MFYALLIYGLLFYPLHLFAGSPPNYTPTGQIKLPAPYLDCRGPLAEPLKKIIGNFELAKESDFVPVIRQYKVSPNYFKHAEVGIVTCTHFAVDLNQDGLTDEAVLLIQPGGKNFRFQILINKGKNIFKPVVTRDYKAVTTAQEGIIYTSMRFKTSNRQGVGNNDSSSLKEKGKKIYLAKSAIEIWDYPDPNPDGTPKEIKEMSTLGYCGIGYYFVKTKLESVRTCD